MSTVFSFCRTRDEPILVTIGLGIGGRADDNSTSISMFDKEPPLSVPEMKFRFLVDEDRVGIER